MKWTIFGGPHALIIILKFGPSRSVVKSHCMAKPTSFAGEALQDVASHPQSVLDRRLHANKEFQP